MCLDLFADQAQRPLTIRARQLFHDREEITILASATR
jgi:23S rRNA (cytidine2498-2'-O)-methyltransferase